MSIPSRRGAALIAMLAVSKDGVRTRGWLQSQLWGSRELKEANLAFTQRRIHWASRSPDCAGRSCHPGSRDRGCHRAARGPGQGTLGTSPGDDGAQRSIAPRLCRQGKRPDAPAWHGGTAPPDRGRDVEGGLQCGSRDRSTSRCLSDSGVATGGSRAHVAEAERRPRGKWRGFAWRSSRWRKMRRVSSSSTRSLAVQFRRILCGRSKKALRQAMLVGGSGGISRARSQGELVGRRVP